MTNETPAPEATPTPQAGEDATVAEQEQPNTGQDTGTWTLDAAVVEIGKLRKEAAQHRTAAKAAERDREKAQAAALAEQGKYKELYEAAQAKVAAMEPALARLDAVIAATTEANERRLAAIPDGMKSLVPDYDDPLKLAAWLDANSAVFQKPIPPKMDAGAGGNSGGPVVDEAKLAAQAVRIGVDPKLYIEAHKRG